MSVKLALLKSGETVISEAKELISDDSVCGYLFENPHIVSTKRSVFLVEDNLDNATSDLEITISPWIILSNDTKIPVPPDWIVTIVEPIDTIKEMYEEKVNGQKSSVSSIEE